MIQLDEIEQLLTRIKCAVDHSASTDIDKKHIHDLLELIGFKVGEVRTTKDNPTG